MQEIPTKPYLLRALYEWCTDNGYTPHIAVRVDQHTRVPRQFVRNDEIVLNISVEATSQLQMGNEWIEFSARFSGKSHKLEVQVTNVLAIYARENGQGMAFPAEPAAAGMETPGVGKPAVGAVPSSVPVREVEASTAEIDTYTNGDKPPPDDGPKGGGRGHLKIVK
jgi:stringent starvation protein B